MGKTLRFGAEDNKKRPETKIFGIGGAGRNILSTLIKDKSVTNMSFFEIGENRRFSEGSYIDINKREIREYYDSIFSVGKTTPNHSVEKIKRFIENGELFYVLSGLGGETGSWTTPICSKMAVKQGFTMSFVAIPFRSEGKSRSTLAEESKKNLSKNCDVLGVFENSRLLEMNPHLPMTKAFEVMNTIIMLPVKDFNAVMTKGDMPHLRKFCSDVDGFRIGAGYGKGRKRGRRASEEAYRSPWLESPERYDTVLTVVTSGKGTAELEAEDALDVIREKSPKADIMWGLRKDPSIGERTRVTLLAGI
ncbi:MAG: hypothetical protein R6W73_04365 [Candidatus Saliniplasma sp.]